MGISDGIFMRCGDSGGQSCDGAVYTDSNVPDITTSHCRVKTIYPALNQDEDEGSTPPRKSLNIFASSEMVNGLLILAVKP